MDSESENKCKFNAFKNAESILRKKNKTMYYLADNIGVKKQNIPNWEKRGLPCYMWPAVAKFLEISIEKLISDVSPDDYGNINFGKPPGCIECDICRKRKFDREKPLYFQDLVCLAIRVYLFLTRKKCKYYIDNECTYDFNRQD
ncbi:MAG: hypothetical protein DBP02_01985 [gamma proteobacterium symbiont of Ctena orbiculata]|nr:MAG: hypothetical protein DBP02_01985 [gamma proteobacterium symbiont of Ctena orbiculata]